MATIQIRRLQAAQRWNDSTLLEMILDNLDRQSAEVREVFVAQLEANAAEENAFTADLDSEDM